MSVDVADRPRDAETTIRYRDVGDGPPVVLLHGVGLDAARISWKHAIPALAETHRVIAPDLPGHGDSDKPNRRYTTDYYIDVVESFVDALDLASVAVAGISMGGAIALGYALRNDVERLALIDSYGLGTDAPWRPAASVALRVPVMDQLLWNTMGMTEGTVRGTLSGYTDQAPPEFVEEVHEIMQDPACGRTLRSWQRSEFRACGFRTCYLEELSDLSVPTLLVHGENDTLLPSTWSERAAARLPDSELHVLADCGHWPPRERPSRFNGLLTDFFAS
ncbi:MAG: alpha/beta fold hydrolase [Haloarculaceae archaeon]